MGSDKQGSVSSSSKWGIYLIGQIFVLGVLLYSYGATLPICKIDIPLLGKVEFGNCKRESEQIVKRIHLAAKSFDLQRAHVRVGEIPGADGH